MQEMAFQALQKSKFFRGGMPLDPPRNLPPLALAHYASVRFFPGSAPGLGYQKILERNLLPFIANTYADGHRLWQDNDPKHTSNSTKKWMKDNGVNHWATPPESPVCNHYSQYTVKTCIKNPLVIDSRLYNQLIAIEKLTMIVRCIVTLLVSSEKLG